MIWDACWNFIMEKQYTKSEAFASCHSKVQPAAHSASFISTFIWPWNCCKDYLFSFQLKAILQFQGIYSSLWICHADNPLFLSLRGGTACYFCSWQISLFSNNETANFSQGFSGWKLIGILLWRNDSCASEFPGPLSYWPWALNKIISPLVFEFDGKKNADLNKFWFGKIPGTKKKRYFWEISLKLWNTALHFPDFFYFHNYQLFSFFSKLNLIGTLRKVINFLYQRETLISFDFSVLLHILNLNQ